MNIFHINLDSLSRILHLFIRLRNIFGVWQFDGLPTDPAQELIQAGDRSGVTHLSQLDLEHHQTSVRISVAHIPDQCDLFLCMLFGMAVMAGCERSARGRTVPSYFFCLLFL